MNPRMLFNGPLDYVILALGVMMALAHATLMARAKHAPLDASRYWQGLLSRLLYLFPMAGIMGTVIGLMQTLDFMGTDGAADMVATMSRFSTALSTTFWGVTSGIANALLNVLLEVKLERGK